MRFSVGVARKRSWRNLRCAHVQTSLATGSFSVSSMFMVVSSCGTHSSLMRMLLSYTMKVLEATGVTAPAFGLTKSLVILSSGQKWRSPGSDPVLERLLCLVVQTRAAAAAASAEARKAVGEFAIGAMLLNGGKGQLYGVGVVQATANPSRNAFLA